MLATILPHLHTPLDPLHGDGYQFWSGIGSGSPLIATTTRTTRPPARRQRVPRPNPGNQLPDPCPRGTRLSCAIAVARACT